MTYSGLWKIAQAKAGVDTAVSLNTAANALVILTELRHELQELTNAVVRRVAINIASPSSDGGFALPDDVKIERDLRLRITGNTRDYELTVVPPEYMDDIRQSFTYSGAYCGKYYYTVERDAQSTPGESVSKIWLFPYHGVTGTLTLRYVPQLLPYDPVVPSGDFADATSDPTDWMDTHGPELEFAPALSIMSDKLGAILMELSQTTGLFAARYQMLHQNWDRRKFEVLRSDRKLSKRTRMPHNPGPLR